MQVELIPQKPSQFPYKMQSSCEAQTQSSAFIMGEKQKLKSPDQ